MFILFFYLINLISFSIYRYFSHCLMHYWGNKLISNTFLVSSNSLFLQQGKISVNIGLKRKFHNGKTKR